MARFHTYARCATVALGIGLLGGSNGYAGGLLCPDGAYVARGPCTLCPDGRYIGAGALCAGVPGGGYTPTSQKPPPLAPSTPSRPGATRTSTCPDGFITAGTRCVPVTSSRYPDS